MNSTSRYILIALGVLLTGFLLWYFSNIVIYIVVSAVLSLIGAPIVDLLGKIQYRNFKLPSWLKALMSLALIYTLFIGFFRIFIPIVAQEANELSTIDVNSFVARLEQPISRIEGVYEDFELWGNSQQSFNEYITEKLSKVLNVSIITNLFSSIASTLGDVFIAIFSISFISFFFLKDRGSLVEIVILLAPEKHEKTLRHAMGSIRQLLSRYFIGIALQLSGILILVTLGMTIVGLGFTKSVLIGLTAAILNVVPYLGPLIGSALGIILGIAFNINMEMLDLAELAGYMLIVFLSVQVIDNILFQPVIFSTSVNAHPLEIFLVIMIAGSVGGVTGMIIAIPTYTIIRVLAREFLSKFRLVKKLTEKL
ncbi:MAG: AI-2E family transporter [Bacteroidales bacterium]|nr:AI-2E family transporter [Bacteroidales bacterium]MCF8405968.1 AI-2E family transporter [Bacteroidales bacterium]